MADDNFSFNPKSEALRKHKTVNIVMRSHNDIDVIQRTIDGILSQKYQDFDILNFDNDSTDGTLEIIKKYPRIKSYNIPAGMYTPGYVLNRAIEVSNCDILVFNNSDSVPLSDDWLSTLIAPISEGKAVAVYARQVPRKNAYIWVRQDYGRCFGDVEFKRNFFSLASSAMSSEIFKTMKFDEKITFSEDVKLANKLRDMGKVVLYVPNAHAEHSHNYTIAQTRRRFEGEGVADALIYGSKQNFFAFVKGLIGGFLRDGIYVATFGKISDLIPCLQHRAIQKWSYYKARRDAFKNLKK